MKRNANQLATLKKIISSLNVGVTSRKLQVRYPYSKSIEKFLNILRDGGLIFGFQKKNGYFVIYLRYNLNGRPAFSKIFAPKVMQSINSVTSRQLGLLLADYYAVILSTNKGFQFVVGPYSKKYKGKLVCAVK